MKGKISVDEALNQVASYCSIAERCKSDIEKKLSMWELDKEDLNSIFEYLEKENFLNESRYASAYVNDKYRFAKWGKKKIAQSLYLKGLDNNMIQESLRTIDKDVYINNLKSILEVKKRSVKAKNSFELNQKLARFALGRGFEYDDIMHVLPDLEDDY
ncbi:Regulatory protein recX [Bacteroides coprosuis DSM 18011]|uniref:Regulatory protein RecX n=1 Tax=Bacteroides coprosuis DSM 18011 TaxID=679937 RepID=F3ZS14_9BACE|nr:regulatory protein RecX [Bacteroides coprosuis]EGJ70820.1 Regulatory protein recX [Bacteroides coprosuis DSM 18011]